MTDEHIQRVVQQAIGTELAYGVNSLAREVDLLRSMRDAVMKERGALAAQRDELRAALGDTEDKLAATQDEAEAFRMQRDELLRTLTPLVQLMDAVNGIALVPESLVADARALIARIKGATP